MRGPKFAFGHLLVTPGAIEALEGLEDEAVRMFQRHPSGDWEDVPPEDKQANDWSLLNGERLMSGYRTSRGQEIWIITEADRSVTTFRVPEEY